ncbi:MAG: MFS transporter [Acidimicrobiales bacterium]
MALDRDTFQQSSIAPTDPVLQALAEQLSSEGSNALGLKPEPRNITAAASWALFVGIALLMIGNGLQGTLLGIRSELEGFSAAASGLVMTSYFIGFLGGSKVATRALAAVGHIRVFAALASMASTATLVHAITITPVTWGLMRFTTGLCMAGLYVVVESWINEMATNANRGKLLALYMAVTMGGIASGQFLLNLADPGGFELFVVASVLISLSLVPISLSERSTPPSRTPVAMSLRELARIVPTGIAVSSMVGMAHGSLLGMGAVYATRAGLSPGQIALFMGAPMVGGVALQFPIGSLSDRVPRRGVMFAVAVAASLCATALLFTPPASMASYVLMFGIGGFSFPLYSLGIAYTNDWISPEQTMGASSALVTTNGVGAILGPIVSAALIIFLGNSMFFVSLIMTHGAIAAYLAFRIVARDAIPISKQGRFIPIPARGSATAIGILAKRRRPRAPRS